MINHCVYHMNVAPSKGFIWAEHPGPMCPALAHGDPLHLQNVSAWAQPDPVSLKHNSTTCNHGHEYEQQPG